MPIHEQKICPRCNQTFECRIGDIMHCQCNVIVLSGDEKNFVEEHYNDCLCINCLKEVKSEYKDKYEV